MAGRQTVSTQDAWHCCCLFVDTVEGGVVVVAVAVAFLLLSNFVSS
jgi:hypothetical protein